GPAAAAPGFGTSADAVEQSAKADFPMVQRRVSTRRRAAKAPGFNRRDEAAVAVRQCGARGR
ncbi:MAG TPA: hypothetical protein VFS20_34230, partial [Longimicrobium sp.]|nr:hypothetical protein [Longimicrobium sp.]